MTAAITIEGLTKRFGRFTAVDNLSLEPQDQRPPPKGGTLANLFRWLSRRIQHEMGLSGLDGYLRPNWGSDGAGAQPPSFVAPRPLWLRAVAFVGPLPERRPDLAWFRFSAWKDLALAAFLSGMTVLVGLIDVVFGRTQLTPAYGALAVLTMTPLVLLAWRPRLCEWLLIIGLGTWAAAVLFNDSSSNFPVFICIYTVATHRSWQRTATAILLAVGFGLVIDVTLVRYDARWMPYGQAVSEFVFYSVVAAIGLWLGRRRAYVRKLVQRAMNLEHERDVLALQAVAVERARIARELHDVVAHHVSVMVIQAGAAQASLPPGAEATGQALEAIRETGREAMAEMRRLLGLLRSEEPLEPGTAGGGQVGGEPGGQVGAEAATRAPQPGMTDLEALAARTRETGVEVALEVVGAPRHISPGIELSAYRVAQEALTNTLRHAGPGAKATLRLLFEPGTLGIEVIDDGHGKPAVESVERSRQGFGHGLVGMRERVGLFGGWLETGSQPGGGYRVLARFPLDDAEPLNGDLPARAGSVNATSSEVRR
jgi:signal transduction histidine kinase